MNHNNEDTLHQHNNINTITIDNDEHTKQHIKNIKGTRILHMNIRSLKKNLDEFTIFLASLESYIDIIVLTEAHLHDDLPNLDITSYESVQAFGKLTKCEGVVVYYKKPWQIQKINHNIIEDCTSLLLQLENNGTHLSILAEYRTPSIRSISTFADSLNEYLSHSQTKPVLVGDINIDILKPDAECDLYLNILSEQGYISCMHKRLYESNNQLKNMY